jgi:putative component of membrane protein insertase Oxa1/YidC/SpoIIIJ protein YidD
MRWLLVLSIRLYRKLPNRFKRRCLFKETCSAFVLRVTIDSGFLAGCRAIRSRFSKCRPTYLVYYDYISRDWQVEFADRTRETSAKIADFVLEPYHLLLAHAFEEQVRIEDDIELRE